MSEKNGSTNIKTMPVAERMVGAATDATNQWLVLIGDSSGDSSQTSEVEDDVLRYLRDMWPEVERDCVSH